MPDRPGRFSSALIRDMVAGGAAGAIGGVVFWWALAAQGMASTVPGLIGLPLSGASIALHVLVAVPVGAGFGAVFRYQPQGHAATVAFGLLYGLLWWVAGPITFGPLLDGLEPTWSVAEAQAAFPSLVGHLLYGGLTGLGFYLWVVWYLRVRPDSEDMIAGSRAAKNRVVILGGGFGGTSAAQRLEQLFSRDPSLEITLVSQSNYLLFTPMLAEVASSALEAQHISTPIRASCPHIRFNRSVVEAIDTFSQKVRVTSGPSLASEEITYDHLVMALGSIPSYFGLPGMAENSFALKSLGDATRLRNHILGLLERSDSEPDEEERRRQLTFVVAGGGFAGTETMAELFDLVHSVLRYYPNLNAGDLRFVLVHPGDRILPELTPELGAYALSRLRARGIEFLLNTRVAGCTSNAVILESANPLPSYTLVWTAGNRPSPLLTTLPAERNRAGALIVDGALRVNGLSNVWAVGDCAQVPDPEVEGRAYPPTAQHALREGKLVAENIAAWIRGKPLKTFRYRPAGILVGLGHHTAVAEIRGWRFSGFLAWFMWRTVYLIKLPGIEKKVRVALDWTIDLFFPRDIVVTSAFDNVALSQTPQELAANDSPDFRVTTEGAE